MKIINFLFILLIVPQAVNAADFNIRNKSLFITGDLLPGDYVKYKNAISNNLVKNINISSNGGVVDDSLEIGFDIFHKKYNVEIFGICASSCANYIFTAGRHKKIQKNALIVWHGSPSTFCNHTMPDIENLEVSKEDLSIYLDYLKNIRIKSDDFFKKVKIDQRLSCLNGYYINSISNYEGYTMWSTAMRKFGVKKIEIYRPLENNYKEYDKKIHNFKNNSFKF